MLSGTARKWLMIAVGVIWSYVTFEYAQGSGWSNAAVWARACLAGVFFLQATIDPRQRQGFLESLRNPKGLMICILLIGAIGFMLIDRR